MKQRHLFEITILIVLVLIGSASGQEMKKHIQIITDGEAGCGGMGCGMGLTEDQQAKFKDLGLKLDKVLIPLKSDLKILDAELDKLLIADKPDKAAINKKIDEIGAVKVKIEKANVKNKLAKRALLTDEQRIKFDKHGCMGTEMNIEKHMMFLGDNEGERKIIIKKMGGEGEPMMWHGKDGDVNVEIKKILKEIEEKEEKEEKE
ncbi:periplasmic heavy metal sensor [candidate division KSB1 bacterium]|nr:periplasmic heavy metal sensor [candidate division KSB1 bacterium]